MQMVCFTYDDFGKKGIKENENLPFVKVELVLYNLVR